MDVLVGRYGFNPATGLIVLPQLKLSDPYSRIPLTFLLSGRDILTPRSGSIIGFQSLEVPAPVAVMESLYHIALSYDQ
ncbi:hypothetical protein Csa_017794 [Cucumis sativus]|nr:hypothetical protein Csa_017794 [Cucumis sativus]